MGLYQRDLGSFREKPVIENKHLENNCVNCHSFSQGSSENMLFHIRGSIGGTMIKKGDAIEKIDLKRDETLSAGVYPSLHPSGDYVAFSTNRIEQYFHASPEESIEVLDRQSDLILYKVASKEVVHVPGTRGDRYMETYPNWSPDGYSLYFSRTEADANTPFDSIRYDIYRIAFDPATGTFGKTEPVFLASEQKKSASFPRISPDGRYLLCTLHDYGTFPIWHKEADLCLIDLRSGEAVIPEQVNSDDTESFHSWSSNSRWIVFSSRRYDGRYTKPYISYLDSEGELQKAFLLPQKDPRSNASFFYSFNRPELITGAIEVNPRQWIRRAREN
jgi:Tol biopolymer transport system component